MHAFCVLITYIVGLRVSVVTSCCFAELCAMLGDLVGLLCVLGFVSCRLGFVLR